MPKFKVTVDYRCTEIYHVTGDSKEDVIEQMDNITDDPVNVTNAHWETEKVEEVTDYETN